LPHYPPDSHRGAGPAPGSARRVLSMSLETSAPWDELRRQMPVARNYAYFDHASIGPLPLAAQQAVCQWATECAESGNVHWSRWAATVETLRAAAARLLGADPQEIALVGSTTQGIGLVAEGYPWTPGDNVVLLSREFPSNQYPWLNLASRGVEPRRVPTIDERVDMDALARSCDSRTRILALSWVGYATGWRNDLNVLADFAHRRGLLLFVDAIQALGVFPLDVRRTPIDFLVAGGQKWLLGPEGTGILYIRQEHLDRLRPLGVGWNSVRHAGDFTRIELDFKPSAERYEGGAQNMAGVMGLTQSVNLLAQFGPAQLGQRLIEVTDAICDEITRAGGVIRSDRREDRKSGIVCFDWPGRDPASVKRQCRARGVVLNARAGRVRVSPHAYCNQQDIDRLLDALRGISTD
jgi:cysteine desulfurase/selenocysteine lyase